MRSWGLGEGGEGKGKEREEEVEERNDAALMLQNAPIFVSLLPFPLC